MWDDDVKEGYFNDYRHEPGAHKVLGKKYRGKPKGKLKALCIDLAKHPMTARHIANKLCLHFISDTPPEEAITVIENVYNQSSGDLSQNSSSSCRRSNKVWRYFDKIFTARTLVF